MTLSRQKLMIGVLFMSMLPAAALALDEPAAEPSAPWAPERPWEVIEVAIALDTSDSMKALIDAVRQQHWEIVHDLTLVEPTPALRVALLTYGHGKNDPEAGWVRVETGLTQDLDLVSERLFALTTGGGSEYVARVLQVALEGLAWTPSEAALKLIFVGGNEAADQDPQVDFRAMTEVARREGISVQPIFCGSAGNERSETWHELAELAQTELAAIDHRAGTVVVKSPVDAELAKLSAAINETYVPLGDEGRKRLEKQAQQDENARKLSPAAAAGRAQVKTSRMYSSGWDLVDALEAGTVDLYELEESELPERLRQMSFEDRELYVEEQRLRREELRQQIAELGEQRRQFVAEQIEVKGLDVSRAFDTAVRRALREKLEEKGFRVPQL